MVTASGGGLDPHIPPAAAELQARAWRGPQRRPVERVRSVSTRTRERPALGFSAAARVNVLELNLALDATSGRGGRQIESGDDMSEHGRRSRSGIPPSLSAPVGDSFTKLDPRIQFRNPVMFIVEVGSAVDDAIFAAGVRLRERDSRCSPARWRSGCGSRCSSRTSRRRWRRGAARPRRTRCARPRTETVANRLAAAGHVESRSGGDAAQRRCRDRATPASSFPPTARSSRASRPSTSPRSPGSRLRSSANRAATVRR